MVVHGHIHPPPGRLFNPSRVNEVSSSLADVAGAIAALNVPWLLGMKDGIEQEWNAYKEIAASSVVGQYTLGRASLQTLESAQHDAAAAAAEVLKWWYEKRNVFPVLAEVAMGLALFLTCSASAERLFSVWNRVMQQNMHEDAWTAAVLAAYNHK